MIPTKDFKHILDEVPDEVFENRDFDKLAKHLNVGIYHFFKNQNYPQPTRLFTACGIMHDELFAEPDVDAHLYCSRLKDCNLAEFWNGNKREVMTGPTLAHAITNLADLIRSKDV